MHIFCHLLLVLLVFGGGLTSAGESLAARAPRSETRRPPPRTIDPNRRLTEGRRAAEYLQDYQTRREVQDANTRLIAIGVGLAIGLAIVVLLGILRRKK